MARSDKPASVGSCRLCRAYCDWVIDPVVCIETPCPNLYAYDDLAGRRIVGCVERVFDAELDLEAFEDARRASKTTLPGLRAVRRPLPVCGSRVLMTYERRLPEAGCVNPEFAEPTSGETIRVTRG